jgi:hypothetical protein
MKKIILGLISLTILVSSCGNKKLTRDEIVRNNAEAYLKTTLNDEKSYEFVDLILLDSVTYKNNIEAFKLTTRQIAILDSISIETGKIILQDNLDFNKQFPGTFSEFDLNEKKADIEKRKIELNYKNYIIKSCDSLVQALGNKVNDVAAYTYNLKCRAKNSFGAIILCDYLIQVDNKDSLLKLTDDKDKLLLYPNQFPGYIKILNK